MCVRGSSVAWRSLLPLCRRLAGAEQGGAGPRRAKSVLSFLESVAVLCSLFFCGLVFFAFSVQAVDWGRAGWRSVAVLNSRFFCGLVFSALSVQAVDWCRSGWRGPPARQICGVFLRECCGSVFAVLLWLGVLRSLSLCAGASLWHSRVARAPGVINL